MSKFRKGAESKKKEIKSEKKRLIYEKMKALREGTDENIIDYLKETYVEFFNSASIGPEFEKNIYSVTKYRDKPIDRKIKKDKFLEYFKGGKILDIGCMEGHHIEWFEGAEKIYCVDIIDNFFDYIKNKYKEKNIECKLTNGSDLSFIENDYLDFIFSMDSLMRLSPTQYASYFNEFKRVLKPGGIAYIHLPIEYGTMKLRHSNDRPYVFTKKRVIENMQWADIDFIDGYVHFGSIALIKKPGAKEESS